MPGRPSLLYLSPVMPDVTGNGLAMRAGIVLELLAAAYDVSLLAIPIYSAPGATMPARLAEFCTRVAVVPVTRATASRRHSLARLVRHPALATRLDPYPGVWRYARGETMTHAVRAFHSLSFDVVHTFRLYMAPFARPYLGYSPRRAAWHIDLDDIESTTRCRLAESYRLNGESSRAHAEELEARRFAALERQIVPQANRLYVCSEQDRREMRGRFPRTDVRVLPNAVRLPPERVPPPCEHSPFTFLFVGTLGYHPNSDGIATFCREVVPLIRAEAPRQFRVDVVGNGVSRTVRELSEISEVRLVGSVPDVAPAYREAHAVVVPIRCGGGTRIKVLEAFSFGRPVISTPVGVEGIAARPEEHLLVGDTPAALAAHCLRLMRDPSLGHQLADRALTLLRSTYTIDALARNATVFSPGLAR